MNADEPYDSMKHRRQWMNVQFVAVPDGTSLWFSRALPDRTHDLTAACAHGVIHACLSRQLLVLADRACQGVACLLEAQRDLGRLLGQLLLARVARGRRALRAAVGA